MATLMGNSHGTVTQTQSKRGQCKNVILYNCTHNCSPSEKIQKGWGGKDEFPKNKRKFSCQQLAKQGQLTPFGESALEKTTLLGQIPRSHLCPKDNFEKLGIYENALVEAFKLKVIT